MGNENLTADGLGNTYTYNADAMITASSGAQYVYDALGQRVAKTGGSNPAETIYFGGMAIALHNPTSGAWTDLIDGNGQMIAEVAGTQTATPEYRLLDHLGSLVVQTDNSGNVTGSNVFLPFGQLVSSTTSDSFQFTGLPQDTENSSSHAGFRNVSTTQGRWLRPDPYLGSYDITNPQSFNRYAYVNGNPLAFVDPSGLDDPDDCGLACYGDGETPIDGPGVGGSSGGGDGGDPFGFDGGGVPDPCAGAHDTCVVVTPGPDPCMGSQTCVVVTPGPDPISPVTIIAGPPPMVGSGGGGGGHSSGNGTNSSAPNNGTQPADNKKKQAQCVAQVMSNAQRTRGIIEAAGGLTIENVTAACLLGGPGAPECAAAADTVVLVNTGLIMAGEWYNESREEAACAQHQ